MHAIDYQDADVGNQLVASLQHIGFAVLRNHPLDTPLLDQLYREWLAFFHSSDKHNYRFREDVENGTQEGYIPPEVSETAVGETAKDLKEFYHVVPGGRVPEALQQNIEAFRAAAFALGRELGALIQASMPAQAAQLLSEPLTDMFSAEDSMLRVLHYPPLSDADQNTEAVRAAAHEDINLITLLPVSEQPGLQVKNAV